MNYYDFIQNNQNTLLLPSPYQVLMYNYDTDDLCLSLIYIENYISMYPDEQILLCTSRPLSFYQSVQIPEDTNQHINYLHIDVPSDFVTNFVKIWKKHYRLIIFLDVYLVMMHLQPAEQIIFQNLLMQRCEQLICSVKFESYYQLKHSLILDTLIIQKRDLLQQRYLQVGQTQLWKGRKVAPTFCYSVNFEGRFVFCGQE
ncbi:Hypothetical_protein [Hexamita inflata]|uniref:Hypothetical_protein n=1 Tax=Hexamita inflata TaxID=28002 RepID=A0ABP1H3T8_9EUKA